MYHLLTDIVRGPRRTMNFAKITGTLLGSAEEIGADRLEFHEECGVKQKKTKTGRLKFVNHPK